MVTRELIESRSLLVMSNRKTAELIHATVGHVIGIFLLIKPRLVGRAFAMTVVLAIVV